MDASNPCLGALHDHPVKHWKLSPMDVELARRWWDYTKAYQVMLEAIDTPSAPWHMVPADDKRRARLNLISHMLSRSPIRPQSYAAPQGRRGAAAGRTGCAKSLLTGAPAGLPPSVAGHEGGTDPVQVGEQLSHELVDLRLSEVGGSVYGLPTPSAGREPAAIQRATSVRQSCRGRLIGLHHRRRSRHNRTSRDHSSEV